MKHIQLLLGLFLLVTLNYSAYATTVLPVSLKQLSTGAYMIFHGKTIANRVEQDPISGQVVTYTDFTVIETIKGPSTSKYTIKQLGGRLPNSTVYLSIHGIPKFTAGEEYLVFLPRISRLGFCSPLGLYQGSYSIQTVNGEKIVSNGRHYGSANTAISQAKIVPIKSSNNTGSTVSLPLATNPENASQSTLTDFISTVRALSNQK